MLNIVVFGLLYVGCAAAFYAYLMAESRPMPNMPDIRRSPFAAKPKQASRSRLPNRRRAA